MRRTLYLQMLYIIDMHRTWIVVEDAFGYSEIVVFRRGRAITCVSRILLLKSILPKNGYRCGMTWSIPELELDRALAMYRKANPDVRRRLEKSLSGLDAKDTETIIRIATHGMVRLELTELPLFKY
ncbi:MAG: hypothetical protein LUC24_02800 [Bacteroidales bacterium]|nr:hypothetical protein [Bacteroidales bacterium]